MNEYIYQYTSVEVLALILDSMQIKFSRLDLVDDPDEKFVRVPDLMVCDGVPPASGLRNLGKACFVSCWTKMEEESISMWDMYGDRKRGVMIGMQEDMFDDNAPCLFDNTNLGKVAQYCRPEKIDVIYDRKEDPFVVTPEFEVKFEELGLHKRKEWAFQNEIRFRIFYSHTRGKDYFITTPSEHEGLHGGLYNSDNYTSGIFYRLKKNVIKGMKLILGPQMPLAKRIIIRALVEKYGICDNNIYDSCFKRK